MIPGLLQILSKATRLKFLFKISGPCPPLENVFRVGQLCWVGQVFWSCQSVWAQALHHAWKTFAGSVSCVRSVRYFGSGIAPCPSLENVCWVGQLHQVCQICQALLCLFCWGEPGGFGDTRIPLDFVYDLSFGRQ